MSCLSKPDEKQSSPFEMEIFKIIIYADHLTRSYENKCSFLAFKIITAIFQISEHRLIKKTKNELICIRVFIIGFDFD